MMPSSAEDDLLRELSYQMASPGSRFASGQVGRAQDRAIAEGLLIQHPTRPDYLAITAAGRRRLAQACPGR